MILRYLAMIAVSGSLLVAGCGSDSDSDTSTSSDTSKDSGQTLTAAVSAMDGASMTVGGVTYDTTSAQFSNDSGTDISPGAVVTIEGPYAGRQGIAHKVKYDSELEGLVVSSSIAMVAGSDPVVYEGTMNVMGQTVVIDAMTIFKDVADPEDIPEGSVVEISGMFQDDGSILAKRVKYEADGLMPDEEIEIKGYVSAYDHEEGTFMLGECKIVITEHTEFDDMDALEDGMKVEVESIVEKVMANPCMIEALEIENEDHDGYHRMHYAKGMVVGELMDGMFTLQYEDHEPVIVMIDENTHYINGTEADIIEGAKLKAVGMYDENDVLAAKLIKFKEMDLEMDFAKVEGEVVSDFMDGMFDLNDDDSNIVTVAVDEDTRFIPLGTTAADIQQGIMLKAVGSYDDNGNLAAKLIKFEDMEIQFEKVEGTVTAELLDDMFELTHEDDNTIMVVVNSETRYMNGTVDDIVIDAKMMAAGMLDDNNNLVAKFILFKDMHDGIMPGVPPMIKYDGGVEAVDLTASTLTVLGQTISVSEDTRIYKELMSLMPKPDSETGTSTMISPADMTMPPEMMLTLEDINVGDYVKVMAYYDDDNVLTARIVEIKPVEEMSASKVFGAITEADASALVVAGVRVVVNDMTEITPADKYDMTKIADAIAAGTELKAMAKGVYDEAAGELSADHIAVHELSAM